MKEKGQGMVEFAVILPLMIMLSISVIYIGAMFLDYQQYSNAARDAARDISLQTATKDAAGTVTKTAQANRQEMVDKLNNDDAELLKRYVNPITQLYTPDWSAGLLKSDGTAATTESDAVDVQVTISLTRNQAMVFGGFMQVLPQELKPIVFKMKLETPVVVTGN